MKIALVNGPNLNLLGKREVDIYGTQQFEGFLAKLRAAYSNIVFNYFQSNVEGELINKLHELNGKVDGILLNAGGYTHTSVALADAVAAIDTPVIEIHISNIFGREDFRHVSYLGKHCKGSVSGFGLGSYTLGVEALVKQL